MEPPAKKFAAAGHEPKPSAPAAEPLKVVVHRPSGSSITVDAESGLTVHQLKRLIAGQWKVPPEQQRISRGTEVLEDSTALAKPEVEAGTSGVEVTVACLQKTYATVHQVYYAPTADDEDEGMTADVLTESLRRQHPDVLRDLLQAAEHGDLVENRAASGYRMCGVFVISKEGGEARICDLDHDVEEYGGLPAWCEVGTRLPFNYWDLEQLSVQSYGTCPPGTAEFGGIGFGFHTEECNAIIGITETFFEGATNERRTDDDDGIEFEYAGQTFKILGGAESLEALREVGVVLGSQEPNVGYAPES